MAQSYDQNIALLGIGLDSQPAVKAVGEIKDALNELKNSSDTIKGATKDLGTQLGKAFNGVKFPEIPDKFADKLKAVGDAMTAVSTIDSATVQTAVAALNGLKKISLPDARVPKYLVSLAEGVNAFARAGGGASTTNISNLIASLNTLTRLNVPAQEDIDRLKGFVNAINGLNLRSVSARGADAMGKVADSLSAVVTKFEAVKPPTTGRTALIKTFLTEIGTIAFPEIQTRNVNALGRVAQMIADGVVTFAGIMPPDRQKASDIKAFFTDLGKINFQPFASKDARSLGRVAQALAEGIEAYKGITVPNTQKTESIKRFLNALAGLNFAQINAEGSRNMGRFAASLARGVEAFAGIEAPPQEKTEAIGNFLQRIANLNFTHAPVDDQSFDMGRMASSLSRGIAAFSALTLPNDEHFNKIGRIVAEIGRMNFASLDTKGSVNVAQVSMSLSRGLQSLASIKAGDIDLEQLRATIRGIASMAADFSSANNAIGAFAISIGKLKFQKDSAQRLTALAQALSSFQRVSPPTETVMRFLEAVGRLADISPKVIRALAGMNAEFNRSSIPIQGTTNDLSMMNREISALRSGMSGLYQTFLTFAHSPVIRFFRSATKDAAEFGRELAYINSITLGEYDTANVSKGILGMSSVLGDSAQIANSFYYAYSSGMRGTEEEMLGFTETMAKLSKVIRADATTTTNAITTIVNSYGLGMGDTQMLADWTTQIIKFGKATGRDLASALGNIVAPAQNAGLTLQELGAGIASLTKVMRTAPAVTGYARLIEKLANPVEKTRKAAAELGITLGREAIQSRGFYNVMKQIHDVAQQNPDVINKIFPDIRGKRAAVQLLTKGWEDFSRQMANFAPGGMNGALGEAFGELYKNTSVQVEALAETFKKLRIEIGEAITSILTLGGLLTPLLTRFNNMGETGRGLIGGVAGVATIAAAMQSVGFLVQTLKAMKLRNQAVLNPTMALPQIMAAMAMPGGAALSTANRLQLLQASKYNWMSQVRNNPEYISAFGHYQRWRIMARANMPYEGWADPSWTRLASKGQFELVKQTGARLAQEAKLADLQKSLTDGATGMRGSWNAAMNSMSLAAASSAASIKNSMLGVVPGMGLMVKGITYLGMPLNRLMLAGNGMNAAQFTAFQTSLLNAKLGTFTQTAINAGSSVAGMTESVLGFVAAAGSLGASIGLLLRQIPAVEKFMDSIGEHIYSWWVRLTGRPELDPLGDHEGGRNFNRRGFELQQARNRQNPYYNVGMAAMQTQQNISELFSSIGKDEEKNGNVIEEMQQKMADEFKNAAAITKKLGDDFRSLQDATAKQKKAGEEYAAAMQLQMKETGSLLTAAGVVAVAGSWIGASIGSVIPVIGNVVGGSIGGAIGGAIMGPIIQKRLNASADEYNKGIAAQRSSAESAMKAAQNGVEDAAKTVEEGMNKLFESAKRAVQIILDAKKFVGELTTLRGTLSDKFTDRMFKNWTTGRQFGYLNERLMRPGGVMEQYNAALASGDFKSAKKLGNEIIGVFGKQEGILSNLAKAAQNANNKTLQLIASMDKFSATAVQGVDYESMEAQKLMSRSFETLPNIPLLTESGFDSNKFLADQQGKITGPIDSLTASMNEFISSQTKMLEQNAAYMKAPEEVIKAVVKSLMEETGKDSSFIRGYLEKRAAKQEQKDSEDTERATNLRRLTNALVPAIDRGKGTVKVETQYM